MCNVMKEMYSVEHSLLGVVNHGLIFFVHHLWCEFWCRPYLPILRIILPENSPEAKAFCDSTDAVVNVAEWGLWTFPTVAEHSQKGLDIE